MEIAEIMQILAQGEDSSNRFKKDINNVDTFAQELIAFSNTLGGKLFIGVDAYGTITGLSIDAIHRITIFLANTANHYIQPAINPRVEIVMINDLHILIIHAPRGINKPYRDKNGSIWVKNGAEKRKITACEEMQHLFNDSGMMISDLDMPYFRKFFEKRYDESLDKQQIPLEQTINNLNLGKDGELNITGALLFAQSPSLRLPSYIVKAVAFPGKSITTESYIDSRDITGKLADIFQQTVTFTLSNTKQVQRDQGINTIGKPEIPKIVLEELIANALIHRDYFISAPIRVFVFSNRIEIISPGHLPNNLTVVNIRAGISNTRNPVLSSFANQLLPYRGIGSGILRALKKYPDIDFIDDRESSQFKCIINRDLK